MSRQSNHQLEAAVAVRLQAYATARYQKAISNDESLDATHNITKKDFSVRDKIKAAEAVATYLELLSQGEFNCEPLGLFKEQSAIAALSDSRLAVILYDYVSEAYADLKPAVILPIRKPHFVRQWLAQKISPLFAKTNWKASDTMFHFSGCDHVCVPDNVVKIERDSFKGCLIEKLVLGERVEIIGSAAFAGCPIRSLVVPDNVVNIERDSFNGCPIEELTLGKGVKKIGSGAFAGCPIKSLVVRDNVEVVRNNSFQGCLIEKLVLGERVWVIGFAAFADCPIKHLVIPNEVVSRELGAHVMNFDGLELVLGPASLRSQVGWSVCFIDIDRLKAVLKATLELPYRLALINKRAARLFKEYFSELRDLFPDYAFALDQLIKLLRADLSSRYALSPDSSEKEAKCIEKRFLSKAALSIFCSSSFYDYFDAARNVLNGLALPGSETNMGPRRSGGASR